MFDQQYLNQHFYDKYFELDENNIIKLSEIQTDGGLNNVVTGLHSNCWGLFLEQEDEQGVIYNVFYVNRKKQRLSGNLLRLTLHDPQRDNLLTIFARALSNEYEIDPIDSFNNFQEATRTMSEKLGFLTVTANELEEHKGKNLSFMVTNRKGLIVIPFIYHKDIYKNIFGDLPEIEEQGDNYVYLMLNTRNRFVKIGKSKRPKHREKTLQAEEPEIIMIALWKAADRVEKTLHKQFKTKRHRGEWFNLSFKDITFIKQYMDSLSKDVNPT